MKQFLSYDVEIVEDFPEGEQPDLSKITPSIGAFCTTMDDTKFFYDYPYMKKETAQKLVLEMVNKYGKGFIPFTWNGLSFDFQLLAHYSGMIEECSRLALNHVDGMFLIVCHLGHFLGLDRALVGAGLETKLHEVTLKDGTKFLQMSGQKAPLLWRSGEFEAVKNYLHYDVVQPLKLANYIQTTGVIRWTSNSGKTQKCFTEMLTVKEALRLRKPDTSWMFDPKPREDFYSWVPEEILKEEGII